MSTHCCIGIKEKDGTATSIYCHWEGYPDYIVPMLMMYYDTEEKVRELISLGNISSLHEKINPSSSSHSFYNPESGVTVAYHRDRGDEWERVKYQTFTIDELGSAENHAYLFDPDNLTWYVRSIDWRNGWSSFLWIPVSVVKDCDNHNNKAKVLQAFEINDIVTVIAEKPDGIVNKSTKGDVGIVTNVKFIEDEDDYDYTVSTGFTSYVYTTNQLRLAFDREIKNKMVSLIRNS